MIEKVTKKELMQLIQEEIQRTKPFKTNGNELLPRKVAAQTLNVKVNTMAVWAMKGLGPAPTKIGTRSMYRRSVLDKYIEDQTMPR